MKKSILCFVFLFVVGLLTAQSGPELKNNDEIRKLLQSKALQAGSDLMSCCANGGGTSLNAQIHWDETDDNGDNATRYNKLSGNMSVCTTLSWVGSVSKKKYWVKGVLTVKVDSNTRSWAKISDSGGFTPGCSRGCIR